MVLAVSLCSPNITPDPEPEPPVSGKAPKIENLPSVAVRLYPAQCNKPLEIPFYVDEDAEVTTWCTAGLTASVARGEGENCLLTILAASQTGQNPHVRVYATNEYGKSSCDVDIDMARFSIDRTSFHATIAGASVTIAVTTNVGCKVSVNEEASSWVHLTKENSFVTVTIDRNESTVAREAEVTFTDKNELLKQIFYVTQDDAPDYYRLEREALIALYNSTDGPNWPNYMNTLGDTDERVEYWCTDAPIANWFGVNVDSKGHVSGLWLGGMPLKGSLPEEIGDLVFCRELYCDNCQLCGELPSRIGEMKSLREIHVAFNELSGDLSKSSLSKLAPQITSLWVDHNYFTGGVPQWIGQIPAHGYFTFSNNCLSGKVPAEVVAHPLWSEMRLDGSGLTWGQMCMIQREGYVLYE